MLRMVIFFPFVSFQFSFSFISYKKHNVNITKLNKHLLSVKVNLNSSFGGGPWVYVGTSR